MGYIDHLGSEARTYRDAKVEWTETSVSSAVLERAMV
jgi:hypothetical protein